MAPAGGLERPGAVRRDGAALVPVDPGGDRWPVYRRRGRQGPQGQVHRRLGRPWRLVPLPPLAYPGLVFPGDPAVRGGACGLGETGGRGRGCQHRAGAPLRDRGPGDLRGAGGAQLRSRAGAGVRCRQCGRNPPYTEAIAGLAVPVHRGGLADADRGGGRGSTLRRDQGPAPAARLGRADLCVLRADADAAQPLHPAGLSGVRPALRLRGGAADGRGEAAGVECDRHGAVCAGRGGAARGLVPGRDDQPDGGDRRRFPDGFG